MRQNKLGIFLDDNVLQRSESHSPSLCSAFFTLKKADGQAFRTAEVQKSAREFSHGLDLSP